MQNSSKFPRRRFLQGLAVTPVVLTAGGLTSAEAKSKTDPDSRRLPILQNWTDEKSAIVTALGVAGWTFAPAEGSNITIQVTNTRTITNSNRVLYELSIEGLAPGVLSRFTISDKTGAVLETRSLKGLDLAQPSPRVSVISCSNYRKMYEQELIWARVQEVKTDLILFIGDIVYANSEIGSIFKEPEPPDSAIQRYVQTWDMVDLYQQEPLVPVVSVWDDHDYGQNNGDSRNPYRESMKEIFRAFYPLPARHERLSYGPGVSFRMTAFGIDIHMLDDRTFADGETQWGTEQENWFFNEYKTSPNPAWLINGIQYFTYSFATENVQSKGPGSLSRMTELLQNNWKPTVLFSGDVHASQIQEIEKEIFGVVTYEITSSAAHSIAAGSWLKRDEESGQLAYYGDNNFLVITPNVAEKKMALHVKCATANDIQNWGTVTVRG